MNKVIRENLRLLVEDLYSEGNMCGISNYNSWYDAWVDAIVAVVDGVPYDEDLVVDCYRDMNT